MRLRPSPKVLRILTLTGLFVVCFLIPVLVLLNLQRFWAESETGPSEEVLFPRSVNIVGAGNFIRVTGGAELVAQPGEDFLLIAWFNLSKSPPLNRKLIVFSNFSSAPSGSDGYALALQRDSHGTRALVYWGDSRRPGKWFIFPEIALAPRTWVMFGLSLHRDRFLGLHMADLVTGGSLNLVGGYDLGPGPFSMESGDLVLGALRGRPFRGIVGPVGLFQKRKLYTNLRTVLKSLVARPLELPAEFKPKQVKLWLPDGEHDQSSAAHKVEVVAGPPGDDTARAVFTHAAARHSDGRAGVKASRPTPAKGKP